MNPLRLLKLSKRTSKVLGLLDDAADRPALYADRGWRARLTLAVRELLEMVPMPPSVRGLVKSMFKNWKTTLIGIAGAIGYAFFAGIQHGLSPKDAIIAAAVGALGLASKDHNVSGGTVRQ